ncbi:MAG: hypothetical protein ABIX01_07090 [Chitinophagaceae bacterium]
MFLLAINISLPFIISPISWSTHHRRFHYHPVASSSGLSGQVYPEKVNLPRLFLVCTFATYAFRSSTIHQENIPTIFFYLFCHDVWLPEFTGPAAFSSI